MLIHLPLVEHWSAREPFQSTQSFIGSVDYAYVTTEGKLILRGWLFSLLGKIYELEFFIAEKWHVVLCYGLARFDVKERLSFLSLSCNFGFVFESPYSLPISIEDRSISILFRARISPEIVQSGEFQLSCITYEKPLKESVIIVDE